MCRLDQPDSFITNYNKIMCFQYEGKECNVAFKACAPGEEGRANPRI